MQDSRLPLSFGFSRYLVFLEIHHLGEHGRQVLAELRLISVLRLFLQVIRYRSTYPVILYGMDSFASA